MRNCRAGDDPRPTQPMQRGDKYFETDVSYAVLSTQFGTLIYF